MLDLAKKHVLGWTTSAALTLALMRFITPNFMDLIIDGLSVGLVWLAAKLSQK